MLLVYFEEPGMELVYAVVCGDADALRRSLDDGADANRRIPSGQSMLHLSAALGNSGIAQILIEAGVDVNVIDSSHRTPLHMAAQEGNCETMELLLKAGADAQRQDDQSRTAFQIANQFRRRDAAAILSKYESTENHTSRILNGGDKNGARAPEK